MDAYVKALEAKLAEVSGIKLRFLMFLYRFFLNSNFVFCWDVLLIG